MELESTGHMKIIPLKDRILIGLGLLTALGTLAMQVLDIGNVKGQVMTLLSAHSKQLEIHQQELKEHGEAISALKVATALRGQVNPN